MHIQGASGGPSYDKCSATLEEQTKLKDQEKSLKDGLLVLQQLLAYTVTTAGVSSATNPLLLGIVTEIQETQAKIQNTVSCWNSALHSTHYFLCTCIANWTHQSVKAFEGWLSHGGRAICERSGQSSFFIPCSETGLLLRHFCGQSRSPCSKGILNLLSRIILELKTWFSHKTSTHFVILWLKLLKTTALLHSHMLEK